MLNDSPIDWRDILKITNNKPELAKEMVAMLGAELPEVKTSINNAYKNRNYAVLLEKVHKLHGSCCYCGVTQLKSMTATLEAKLKQLEYQGIDRLVTQINQEIDLILNYINEQALTP